MKLAGIIQQKETLSPLLSAEMIPNLRRNSSCYITAITQTRLVIPHS